MKKPVKGDSGRGQRHLHEKVKTAKGRKLSSKLWLERQLNDPYVKRATAENRRSRAIYKLMEIDDKFRFLTPGKRVVDLGCAPGGWCQIAAERVNSIGENGRAQGYVLGVDLQEVEPIAGVTLMHLDFMDEGADEKVKQVLDGPADVVMSDMAASSTGHRQTDHIRIIGLCEAAALFARETLNEGGVFVAKVLRGGADADLLTQLKRDFRNVRHFKPGASRSDSAEIFLVAQGFRGESARGR